MYLSKDIKFVFFILNFIRQLFDLPLTKMLKKMIITPFCLPAILSSQQAIYNFRK